MSTGSERLNKKDKFSTTQDGVTMVMTDDGSSTMDPKAAEEEARCRFEAEDLDGLRLLLKVVEEIEKKAQGISAQRKAWKGPRVVVKAYLQQLEEDQATANTSNGIKRVASITVGLDEELKHQHDLFAFEERVRTVFHWYTQQSEMFTYMAPYFPVIQSSGTGKTKLFMAFRAETKKAKSSSKFKNYVCKTVICLSKHADQIDKVNEYFDASLHLLQTAYADDGESHTEMTSITKTLQDLMSSSTKGKKLVLLFDEAPCLLSNNDGSAFRRICWWLREKHKNPVVAVFAGTTPKLARCYKDSPPLGTSRNPPGKFLNWNEENEIHPTKRYDPFVLLCTMGCFHDDAPTSNDLSDFERAAYFGRPLFAYLQRENKLCAEEQMISTVDSVVITNTRLHAIFKRMLASKTDDWENSTTALCSILGSRVQMGITTSFVLASDLVAQAYAHLVHFNAGEDLDLSKAVARISFMPDPVCAALAMGMMNKDWSLTNGDGDIIIGKATDFWSRKAVTLLSSGLCLPEKGDIGEIMAALYMLFCGDLLRQAGDKFLRKFSVLLRDWYGKMKNNNSQPKAILGNSVLMDVNFIQVCRNYFRAHSWKTQKALELMYASATAIYVYPGCEAIDLVAAVRVMVNGKPYYHPMLVSVKCWMQMSKKAIGEAMDNMKKLLANIREGETQDEDTVGNRDQESGELDGFQVNSNEVIDQNPSECPPSLCLLLLIGAPRPPNVTDEFNSDDLGRFPQEDTFRMISVPSVDEFGISNAVREITNVQEMTEIFASHRFVYAEDGTDDEKQKNILRRQRPSIAVTSFVKNLFSAFAKKMSTGGESVAGNEVD